MLKFLIEFLSKSNWPIAVLCFVTAATFWCLNALNKGGYNNVVEYPLEFLYENKDLVATKDLPDHLEIAISGNGWNLLRKTAIFERKPIEISLANPVNTKWVLANNYRSQLLSQLGTSVNLNAILSDTLFIDLEEERSIRLPIITDSTQFSLRNDHRVVSAIQVDIDSISFTGPSSFIDTLGSGYLLNILEEGISRNFEEDIEIPLPSNLVKADPQSVKVVFEVAEFISKELKFPIRMKNQLLDSTLVVVDSIATVLITIDENETDALDTLSLNLELDLGMVKSSGSYFPALIDDLSKSGINMEIDSIAPVSILNSN